MKKIKLTNFIKSEPGVPVFNAKNQHYMISGVDPLYYASQNSTQEEQVAPLVASFAMKTAFTDPNSGIITDIIPASAANGGANPGAWTIDSANYIFDGTNSYLPGSWTSSSSQSNFLTQFGSFIIASANNQAKLQYISTISYGSFADVSSPVNFGSAPVYLQTFSSFCAVCYFDKIYSMTISSVPVILTNIPVFQLGNGWTILGRPEPYGNYLSVAGSKGSSLVYKDNYLFFWDGFSTSWKQSISLPGKFIGQVNIGGILNVVVESKTGVQTLYYVKGTSLVKQKLLHGIFTTNTNKRHPVIAIGDFIGILSDSGVFKYRKDEIVGEISYMYQPGNYNAGCTAGTNNYFYATSGLVVSNDTITSNVYNNISYNSQWIPVNELQGIDVIYEQPPQSGTDAINLTIYGRGEDIQAGSSITILNPITSTSFLNQKRTRVDPLGFTGDKILIQLSTINSTWQPNIQEIDIITN